VRLSSPQPLFCRPVALLALAVVCATTFVAAGADKPIVMSAADVVPWTTQAELEAFAARGHLKANEQLGEQLLRGEGVARDVPRALALLERAARGGLGGAALTLGLAYEEGKAVPKDPLRAFDYYRAAAAAGSAEACFNLGAAYVEGRGVKRDQTEGLAWLILAGQRGAEPATEKALRARLQKLRRPEAIATAEQRARSLQSELTAASAASFLPAPSPAPITPAAPPRAAPSLPTPVVIKPDVPALARPTAPTLRLELPPPAPPKVAPPQP